MNPGSPESDSIVMLDHDECERARVRRDRGYDGRFFSGVRTTRIYCRRVGPVRPAQGKNVEFYATAAAAEAAGFPPLPALPARDGAVLARLAGVAHDCASRRG